MSATATESHLAQVQQEIIALERQLGNANQAVDEATVKRDEVAVALASARELEATLQGSLS